MFEVLWLIAVVYCAAIFPVMIFEEADKGNWRVAIFHALALGALAWFVKYHDLGVYLLMATIALGSALYQLRVLWLTPTLYDVVEPVHLGIGATDAARIRNQ